MIQRYWTALPGDDDYGNGMAAYACVDGGGGNVVLYADHLAEMQANNNKWQEVVDLKDKTISTLRAHLELAKGRGK